MDERPQPSERGEVAEAEADERRRDLLLLSHRHIGWRRHEREGHPCADRERTVGKAGHAEHLAERAILLHARGPGGAGIFG